MKPLLVKYGTIDSILDDTKSANNLDLFYILGLVSYQICIFTLIFSSSFLSLYRLSLYFLNLSQSFFIVTSTMLFATSNSGQGHRGPWTQGLVEEIVRSRHPQVGNSIVTLIVPEALANRTPVRGVELQPLRGTLGSSMIVSSPPMLSSITWFGSVTAFTRMNARRR